MPRVALEEKQTSWCGSTTQTVMSPLPFTLRQIDWQFWGHQIRECHVASGS